MFTSCSHRHIQDFIAPLTNTIQAIRETKKETPDHSVWLADLAAYGMLDKKEGRKPDIIIPGNS